MKKLSLAIFAAFVCVAGNAHSYKLRTDIRSITYYCNEICKGCDGEASLTLDVCICNIDSEKTDIKACLKKAMTKFTFLGIKWEGGRNKRSSESVEAHHFIDEMPMDMELSPEEYTTKSMMKRSLREDDDGAARENNLEVTSGSDSSEESETFKLYFSDPKKEEQESEAPGLDQKADYGFWYPSQSYDHYQYEDESSDWSSDYSDSDEECDGDEECERSDMKETNVFHLFQPRRATFHISPGSGWGMASPEPEPSTSTWDLAFPAYYNQHLYYPKNYVVQFAL